MTRKKRPGKHGPLSRIENEPFSQMADDVIAARLAVEGLESEEVEPHSYPSCDRPEHIPSGYEWLPDAYKKHVSPHEPVVAKRVRQALADGRIPAILHLPTGQDIPVHRRMWSKEPLSEKVWPRFDDGWMGMNLTRDKHGLDKTGKKIYGWIFVPLGLLSEIISEGRPIGSPASKGRPKGTGTFAESDAPLIEEMATLIRNGRAKSLHDAASKVADRAEGVAAFESKVRRLMERYKKLEKK